jgi:phytanoyl-CoA hydroxylase
LDIAHIHLQDKREPIELESEYIGKSTNELKQSVRRLRQVYDRDSVFKEWMHYPKIRPILKSLLNDKISIILAHHNSIMTKLPQTSTQTSWHQDIRYWNYQDNNLLSVWLALDREDKTNGVLEFIPNSHNIIFDKSQFEDKEYFSSSNPKNEALIKTKISNTLNKGDVVIFHSKLLHRANKNTSKKAKISFVYTVKTQSNKALENTRSAGYREIILK